MTSQKYAVLDGTDVVNIILLDEADEYTPPEGHLLLPVADDVSIGWRRAGGTWLPIEEPQAVPQPSEDPDVTAAKYTAVEELMALGITEATARRIVSLPVEA
jgi:hypothetical protein